MKETTSPTLSTQMARFIAGTGFADLPAEVITLAKHCFADGLAVLLAGSTEDCAVIARRHVEAMAGAGQARTLGAGSLTAPVQLAAFANGIAGHALDWDDTAMSRERDRSVLLHPTMPPLTAALAMGEMTGATGREVLTAFVLGFEIEVKMAEAIHPDHFAGGRGFHSTGTIGVFGSCVAASKLLGLTEEQIRNAIALAATMAAGLGVNHGTMAKPLNMGRAAETGVTAALMARLGFDGPAKALEGGRGFFEAFGGGYAPDKILGRLGAPWALITPGTSVKPYPSGVVGHPGMDAMQRLVVAHDIRPEDVDSITVRTGPNVIAPGPLRILHANTALEAKFCVPFQMAAMVLRRKAGMTEFADAFVQSADCQAMQKRVSLMLDPDIAALGKDKVVFDIELTTRQGLTCHERSEPHYRGGPKNPLSWQALCDKFQDCATGILDADAITAATDRIARLEDLPSLDILLDGLT